MSNNLINDPNLVRMIREAITDAVNDVLSSKNINAEISVVQQHQNLNIDLVKLELTVNGTSNGLTSRDAIEFLANYATYGFAREDLGKTFNFGRKQYTLVGMKMRRYKRPMICQRFDGRSFAFTMDQVKIAIGRK